MQGPWGSGGESGIRTHGRFDPSPVFKTGALNRSAISPLLLPLSRGAFAPCRFYHRPEGRCSLRPAAFAVKTGALNRSAISPLLLLVLRGACTPSPALAYRPKAFFGFWGARHFCTKQGALRCITASQPLLRLVAVTRTIQPRRFKLPWQVLGQEVNEYPHGRQQATAGCEDRMTDALGQCPFR